jgi:hypothetical protein
MRGAERRRWTRRRRLYRRERCRSCIDVRAAGVTTSDKPWNDCGYYRHEKERAHCGEDSASS